MENTITNNAMARKATDERYMSRALDLALLGAGHVSPNPMVGAVIVTPDGRIIGEGFHRRYGEGHAEVNAMSSVSEKDISLIKDSTIYVTLEPCSHYGKTPPCAKLLCDKGIKRCVIGIGDPNPKVAGRGIKMLREAGIEVTENVLRDKCEAINRRFFTAYTKHRPWILLKWSETSTGAMNAPDGSPIQISSPATTVLMHRERAMCDAIMVGTGTLIADNPSLTTRHWPGQSPRPVIFESPRITDTEIRNNLKILSREPIFLNPEIPLEENMRLLFEQYGVSSLMVEGGPTLLKSFIDKGLYDKIRVERNELIP